MPFYQAGHVVVEAVKVEPIRQDIDGGIVPQSVDDALAALVSKAPGWTFESYGGNTPAKWMATINKPGHPPIFFLRSGQWLVLIGEGLHPMGDELFALIFEPQP